MWSWPPEDKVNVLTKHFILQFDSNKIKNFNAYPLAWTPETQAAVGSLKPTKNWQNSFVYTVGQILKTSNAC